MLALYLFTASRSTLWDRDEGKFAGAALEMERSGRLLYPTFRGEIRAQKPILAYWLMIAAFRVFGPSAWAARFWSAVAAASACAATYAAGRRLFSGRAGLWAMAALASSPLLLVEATAATADAILLAAITGAMTAFAFSLERGMTTSLVIVLAISVGLALLAKGPVGLAVPVLVIAGTLAAAGGTTLRVRADRMRLAAGVLLGCLIFMAWLLPADRATGGRFVREGLGREVLARAARPMEGHGGGILSAGYYLPVILLGFSPWTLYLPGAISAAAGGRLGGARGRALLVGWAVPALLLFSFVATKLPHYVLPLWPALALAVGAALAKEREGALSPRDRLWLARGIWLFAPLVAVESVLVAVAAFLIPAPELRLPGVVAAAGLGAVGIAVTRRHAAGRYAGGAMILAVAIPCLEAFAAAAILPAFERFKAAPAVAAATLSYARRGVPIRSYGFDSPSLDFALDASVLPIPDRRSLESWLESSGPGVLVTTAAVAGQIFPASRSGLREIARVRSFEYDKGRWTDVVVAGLGLPVERRP